MEQVSIDEAFLDVAGSEALFGPPDAIAASIKATIRAEIGLTASVGVAATKLVAKVASDLRKPDGLVVVPMGEEAAFLAPLPIGRLWGVGEKTRVALAEFGVRTIGDLAEIPADALRRRFGEHGAQLAERARGIDPSVVEEPQDAKSISHEHTFDVDTSDREVIERTLLGLSEGVAARLRAAGLRAGTVAVKVRASDFSTHTRQRTLADPTDLADPIWRTALDLARPLLRGTRVRLLGVAASSLAEPSQMPLFDEPGAVQTPPDGRGGRRDQATVRAPGCHPGPPARGLGAGAVRTGPGSEAGCPGGRFRFPLTSNIRSAFMSSNRTDVLSPPTCPRERRDGTAPEGADRCP